MQGVCELVFNGSVGRRLEESAYMLAGLKKVKLLLCGMAGLLALCMAGAVLAASPVLDRVVDSGVLFVRCFVSVTQQM